jgi:hypothetical protein
MATVRIVKTFMCVCSRIHHRLDLEMFAPRYQYEKITAQF